jgi:hypothetical protein
LGFEKLEAWGQKRGLAYKRSATSGRLPKLHSRWPAIVGRPLPLVAYPC